MIILKCKTIELMFYCRTLLFCLFVLYNLSLTIHNNQVDRILPSRMPQPFQLRWNNVKIWVTFSASWHFASSPDYVYWFLNPHATKILVFSLTTPLVWNATATIKFVRRLTKFTASKSNLLNKITAWMVGVKKYIAMRV